jgi:hypothetical protein
MQYVPCHRLWHPVFGRRPAITVSAQVNRCSADPWYTPRNRGNDSFSDDLLSDGKGQ